MKIIKRILFSQSFSSSVIPTNTKIINVTIRIECFKLSSYISSKLLFTAPSSCNVTFILLGYKSLCQKSFRYERKVYSPQNIFATIYQITLFAQNFRYVICIVRIIGSQQACISRSFFIIFL